MSIPAVDPLRGHTPSKSEEERIPLGESIVGRSCGARPRSAVTVSLHLPSLARLTRSVRSIGSGGIHPRCDGTGAPAIPVRCDTPSLGFTARGSLMSDIPVCPRKSSSRDRLLVVPAHFILVGHSPPRRPSRLWSFAKLVGHEV